MKFYLLSKERKLIVEVSFYKVNPRYNITDRRCQPGNYYDNPRLLLAAKNGRVNCGKDNPATD